MISYSQTIVITHNDPNADTAREQLLADGWMITSEDTGTTTYMKSYYFNVNNTNEPLLSAIDRLEKIVMGEKE